MFGDVLVGHYKYNNIFSLKYGNAVFSTLAGRAELDSGVVLW